MLHNYDGTVLAFGITHQGTAFSLRALHALSPATAAVSALEPLVPRWRGHEDSLLIRSMISAEDSMSSAWALRYSNANL